MRYEIAEVADRLPGDPERGPIDASLSAMLGSCPATPNWAWPRSFRTDARVDPKALPVLADGKPTDGTPNRDKILQAVKGHAISAPPS